MPAKNLLRVAQEGAYLHIYNSGVENRSIFCDEYDYKTFLQYIAEYLTDPSEVETEKKSFTVNGKTYQGTPHKPKNYFGKIDLVAYGLMPDHFHLLVHQRSEGMLQNFIRSLCTRYSIYFNKKYKRNGALFGGPYKSAHIADENILFHLVAYIHSTHGNTLHSSSAEYLSYKKTKWIASDEIFNLYSSAEKSVIEPQKTYKEFTENYTYDEKEQSLLSSVIIEAKPKPVTQEVLTAPEPKTTVRKVETKREYRIPEYIALSVVFVTLLGLGVRNIGVTTLDAQTSDTIIVSSPSPVAMSSEYTPEPEAVSSIDEELASSETVVLSATASAEPVVEPNSLVYSYVVIKDGSGIVDVYKEQDTDSEVITTAHDKDHFVAFPVNEDWYEVRFSDETSGYIMSEYINIEQEHTQ